MDVHCSTCDESWDTHHLWHDAIFETGVLEYEAKTWASLPRKRKLTKHYRKKFRSVGWEFGQCVINVIHCPRCPHGAQPNRDRVWRKAALEELMGDDETGLAALFEESRL